MYPRRNNIVKYLIVVCLGVPLYSEWLLYVLQPLYWAPLQCEAEDSCVKVLFIADPQVEGELAVRPPLNYLFIWDADRFLKKTFSVVYNHFKPDVMVYLGDLTDQGSIATMPQFHRYVQRLNDIFDVPSHVVQVWLPGDNDIGGENEPIERDKVAEFEETFKQPSIITYRNVTFYKVNGITHTYPTDDGDKGSQYKIVVSHYPVTLKPVFGHQVDKAIHPNIYFCAHDHVSKYVRMEKPPHMRDTLLLNDYGTVLTVATDQDTHEIYVPTCSYRMGTSLIGYGAAVIDKTSQQLKYTVFWSPKRFNYLFLYAALLAIYVSYCLVYCVAKLCYRKATSNIWSTDKVPLLDRI